MQYYFISIKRNCSFSNWRRTFVSKILSLGCEAV